MKSPTQGKPAVATERQREEYDRFGPWTFPVRAPEEMPPRFDAYYEELRDSTLMLKLPLGVERRNANPGEDLYEAILAVGRKGLTYLRLSRGEVFRRDSSFGEIAAVRLAQELLRGELRIDLAGGGEIRVVFNTVSADAFDDFVRHLRGFCAAGSADEAAPAWAGRLSAVPPKGEPTEEDMLFKNLLCALRDREKDLSLLAYQPSRILGPAKEGGRRGLVGLAARLLRWRLDGCLLAATAKELIILVRGSGLPRIGSFKGYRYEFIYLSAAAFRGAALEGRSVANGALLSALRISTAGCDFELFFEKDSAPVLASVN
jgi:hypothetical protein